MINPRATKHMQTKTVLKVHLKASKEEFDPNISNQIEVKAETVI
jgi:hypothetical protein